MRPQVRGCSPTRSTGRRGRGACSLFRLSICPRCSRLRCSTRSRRNVRRTSCVVLCLVCGCGHLQLPTPDRPPALDPVMSGTTALLQAVSAPSERVVWVSGHRATVLRSTDGGATWALRPVTGADSGLQFRDIAAFDSTTAYVLAAGNGERSRIYKTTDGGTTWSLQFVNQDSAAFYDCFAFWDTRRGLVFSDAVQGRFMVRITADGGTHWRLVEEPTLPTAQRGEGAFAASGTCVVALGSGAARIGTGAADTARLLATDDGGRTWRIAATPLTAGSSAGIATLAFRDAHRGWGPDVETGGTAGDGRGGVRRGGGAGDLGDHRRWARRVGLFRRRRRHVAESG